MQKFGTTSYGPAARWISSALYVLCFATRRDSPRGCQIFALFRADR
jgi:hypothetical protein